MGFPADWSMKKIVVDTSALINGIVSGRVESGEWHGVHVIVPHAAMAELEHQANEGRETGFVGLSEVKKLAELARAGFIKLEYAGDRPTPEEIERAKMGAIDAKIRELARQEGATLVTCDYVQAEVARAYGIPVEYVPPAPLPERPSFMKYFDEQTMSVHLREGVPPMAKRGRPGAFKLVKIGNKPLRAEELKELAKEIVERARREPDAYIEMERNGATVVQYKEFRIAIAYPPFSDGWEITIVRPIAKVTLDDYKLSEKLKERLETRAEGILIAGPPGAGKSTFAQALAEFYASKGKIVKTMESPRDLQVPPEITQYAPLEGDMEKTADILLLVRPDYTIYDELRKTRDFEIFADMRMAGVGMVGVVHASRPIEAIQRFVHRMELGLIPQIVDTVIFIKDGRVQKVYKLNMTVKVPTGMTEEDLARPVVEVRDFETDEVEYEIYTFGEQTVVVPVSEAAKKSPLEAHAERSIEMVLSRRLDVPFRVVLKGNRVILQVRAEDVPKVIGRKGKRVAQLEAEIGLPISVEAVKEEPIEESGRYYIVKAGKKAKKRVVQVLVDGEVVFEGRANKRGIVKIDKNSPEGLRIWEALREGKRVEVRVR